MINPVSGPRGALSGERDVPTSVQSNAQAADYRSTIRSGRRNPFPFFGILKNHFCEIWNWIKYNIFFCVFDAEEEKEEELKTQLEEYVKLYFDREAVPSRARVCKLKKVYERLDSEIKEEIEAAIGEILKEAKPDISTKRIKALVKKIIDKPFSKIWDKTKPKEQQKIHVMGTAILQVNNKLAGYTKE